MSGRAFLVSCALAIALAGCAGRPRQLSDGIAPGASEVRWVLHDSLLAVALNGRGVALLESASGRERFAWRMREVPPDPAFGLATSAGGETLVVATADSVRVFAARGLVPLCSMPGRALAVAITGDGSQVSWTDGQFGCVLDVASGRVRHEGALLAGRHMLAWSPTLGGWTYPFHRYLMIAPDDSAGRITLGPFMDRLPRQWEFSATGATLAVAESTDHVSFWDVRARRMKWRLSLAGGAGFEDMALSPDGARFATSRAGRARVAWAYSGRTVADWVPHEGARVRDLAFARDGSRLATVGANGDVRTWALPAPRKQRH